MSPEMIASREDSSRGYSLRLRELSNGGQVAPGAFWCLDINVASAMWSGGNDELMSDGTMGQCNALVLVVLGGRVVWEEVSVQATRRTLYSSFARSQKEVDEIMVDMKFASAALSVIRWR